MRVFCQIIQVLGYFVQQIRLRVVLLYEDVVEIEYWDDMPPVGLAHILDQILNLPDAPDCHLQTLVGLLMVGADKKGNLVSDFASAGCEFQSDLFKQFYIDLAFHIL